MKVIDNFADLSIACKQLVGDIGLVPTMGALHDGHIALVKQAQMESRYVIVTIFINPTQFAENEDLSKYPRDLPRDLHLLEDAGADIVFTPTSQIMYPPNFQTWIDVECVSQGLEGLRRPGHFRGVATIVAKLFNLTQPQRAYFGQKDAQQVAVIKQMARDLNFPIAIRVCPTIREHDGLAMSSRNVYLTQQQRARAPIIYKALLSAKDAYNDKERNVEALRAIVENILNQDHSAEIDYVSIVDAATLQNVSGLHEDPILISVVVKLGTTRLLDNLLLPSDLNTLEGLTSTLGKG